MSSPAVTRSMARRCSIVKQDARSEHDRCTPGWKTGAVSNQDSAVCCRCFLKIWINSSVCFILLVICRHSSVEAAGPDELRARLLSELVQKEALTQVGYEKEVALSSDCFTPAVLGRSSLANRNLAVQSSTLKSGWSSLRAPDLVRRPRTGLQASTVYVRPCV